VGTAEAAGRAGALFVASLNVASQQIELGTLTWI
jgi:hypothetical protein